jgi:hypothetical protein
MPTATPITLSTVKSGMCFLGGQVPRPKNNLLVERAAGNPIGGGRHFDPQEIARRFDTRPVRASKWRQPFARQRSSRG